MELVKTVAFVASIITLSIGDGRAVLICDAALGDDLDVSIKSSVSSFSSSSVLLSFLYGDESSSSS